MPLRFGRLFCYATNSWKMKWHQGSERELLLIFLCVVVSCCASPYQFYATGSLTEKGASNVLFGLNSTSPSTSSLPFSVLYTFKEGMAPWSGQLSYFSSVGDFYYVWLVNSSTPPFTTFLVQYNVKYNSSKILLELEGALPFDMSWDPSNGGRLWAVVSNNHATQFGIGYYSFSSNSWTHLLDIPTSQSSFFTWSSLAATLDATQGTYYLSYFNQTSNSYWMAYANLKTLTITFKQFPTSASTGAKLVTANRRRSISFKGIPSYEFIECRFSAKQRQLYTLCVDDYAPQQSFYLATLNPSTLELTAIPVPRNKTK